MKVLAKIEARSTPDGAGTLRRREMETYERLLSDLAASGSLLVTGSGAGRRALALGLATTAIARGRKAALLECDLADPTLADRLGLANAPGLHEYLTGATDAAGVLQPLVLSGPGSAGASEPLVCVVAGRRSGDAAPRLFAADAFAEMLTGLLAAYDLLVLEGPRLDEWSSLTLLAPYADATIACVGPEESRRQMSIPVNGIVIEAGQRS